MQIKREEEKKNKKKTKKKKQKKKKNQTNPTLVKKNVLVMSVTMEMRSSVNSVNAFKQAYAYKPALQVH